MAALTEEQERVADHQGGHALVAAVAGSGKTTTLVERVARLVENGVPSHRIICLMFNKSAQEAFQRRLRKRIGQLHGIPEVRTYHSIGLAMMKKLVAIGEMKPASLQKSGGRLEQQARRALNDVWKRHPRGQPYPDADLVEAMPAFITQVKATVRSPEEVFEARQYSPRMAPLIDAFKEFERISLQTRVMYFDDMIYRTVLHVIAKPSLWKLFNGYDEILVDEFQDTNEVQFSMLTGMASDGANVMVVGDDDQAIYGFRGSDVDFILKIFPEQFHDVTRYPMSTTFRYGHETCLAAANVISRNQYRTDKFPVAHPTNPDTRIHVQERISNSESGILPYLSKLQASNRLVDSAMLVRFYSQSVPYEIELMLAGVPYHVYGREPLIFVPEIAALFTALSIAEMYWTVDVEHREVFMEAILRSPSMFLPREDVRVLARKMVELSEREPWRIADPVHAYARERDVKSPGQGRRVRERADTIAMLASGALRGHPPKVIVETYLRMTSMLETIAASSVNAETAQEGAANVKAFAEMAGGMPDTRSLLDLVGPMAAFREDKPPAEPHLQILSLHRSKGLEYGTVFLPGWTAGGFPRSGEDIEEDRRLAYVGITRAQRNVVFLIPGDEGLREWIRNPGSLPRPGTTRACSDFLFDADIGLCRNVASLIRTDRDDVVITRDERIAARYVDKIGRSGIKFQTVEGAATILALKPVTPSTRISPGMRVIGPERGECEVVRLLYGPVYLLRHVESGDQFPTVIENGGWVLAPSEGDRR